MSRSGSSGQYLVKHQPSEASVGSSRQARWTSLPSESGELKMFSIGDSSSSSSSSPFHLLCSRAKLPLGVGRHAAGYFYPSFWMDSGVLCLIPLWVQNVSISIFFILEKKYYGAWVGWKGSIFAKLSIKDSECLRRFLRTMTLTCAIPSYRQ